MYLRCPYRPSQIQFPNNTIDLTSKGAAFQGTLDLGQLVPRIWDQQNIIASGVLVQRLNLARQSVEGLSLTIQRALPFKSLSISLSFSFLSLSLSLSQHFWVQPSCGAFRKPFNKDIWSRRKDSCNLPRSSQPSQTFLVPRGASFTGGGTATLSEKTGASRASAASSVFVVPYIHCMTLSHSSIGSRPTCAPASLPRSSSFFAMPTSMVQQMNQTFKRQTLGNLKKRKLQSSGFSTPRPSSISSCQHFPNMPWGMDCTWP